LLSRVLGLLPNKECSSTENVFPLAVSREEPGRKARERTVEANRITPCEPECLSLPTPLLSEERKTGKAQQEPQTSCRLIPPPAVTRQGHPGAVLMKGCFSAPGSSSCACRRRVMVEIALLVQEGGRSTNRDGKEALLVVPPLLVGQQVRPMGMSRSPISSHAKGTPSTPPPRQSRRLRILLIGPELRVEELRVLLSEQADMQILPPITDLDQALDVLSRMSGNGPSRIDVVIMEWELCEERHYHLLRVLCKHLRCLVIAPAMAPGEMKRLEEVGAGGYCSTTASSQQLVKAIRKVAKGEKYFHPTPPAELRPHLTVKRHPVFFQERLKERAQSIGWPLSELELLILAHFDGANNDEIASRIHRPVGTVRSATSRVFFLLEQLSEERKKVPNRLVAFQVLLELGIIEYK
jgi:DNA-binding NarL/FixJ family response regulator